MNWLKKIHNAYCSLDTLEQKMYWMLLPLVFFASIPGALFTILEIGFHQGAILMLCMFAFSGTNMLIAYKTGKITVCYNWFVVIFGSVLVPLLFLYGGGFYSGMPILCTGAVIFCAFCYNTKTRLITGFLAILANGITIALTVSGVITAVDIPQESRVPDICLVLFLVSAGVFMIAIVTFREFRYYSDKTAKLIRHIDAGVIPMIDGTEGNGKGSERKVAIAFIDICNFTRISESMDPALVADYLGVFFETADKHIHKNGGILDKYIGDCVMAYWIDKGNNNPVEQACRAVTDIIDELKLNAEEIYSRFKCDLDCSAGINYGNVILGEIGSSSRMDFTVIGDVVNVASRLENLAPIRTIYMSEAAAIKVSDRLNVKKVEKQLALKGKSTTVDVYSLESLEKAPQVIDVRPPAVRTGYVLYICGCRGSYPVAGKRFYEYGGETSCYVIKKGDYALIVDCGTGMQRAREIIADCTNIDVILTHVHYDHIIGLLDWSIFPQNAHLRFFGNFAQWFGDDTFHELLKPPFWPVDLSRGVLLAVNLSSEYKLTPDISATFFKATHPNEATLIALKIEGKKVCIMADCENSDDMPHEVLRDCDILMYDGMYEEHNYKDRVGWGHSTWESGVHLAQFCNVKRLIITHHSPISTDAKLYDFELKAKEMFAATTFAKTGERYII